MEINLKNFDLSVVSISKTKYWDSFISESENGTIFHYSSYLSLFDINEALCVFINDQLIAALPLCHSEDKMSLLQKTIFVPYGGVVFKRINDIYRKKANLRRKLLYIMIAYLQTHFVSVCFTLIGINDVVPFLRLGFTPEIRYTYLMNLEESLFQIYSSFSDRRKRELQKTEKMKISIEKTSNLNLYNFSKSASHIKSGDYTEVIKKICSSMIKKGNGQCFVAINRKSEVVGGLILVWDQKRSYTIFSYYENEASLCGIPTALHYEAMNFTKNELHLHIMDFEGSVLEGVEAFYQSFGGTQEMYFKMHWDKNNNINYKGIYHYE